MNHCGEDVSLSLGWLSARLEGLDRVLADGSCVEALGRSSSRGSELRPSEPEQQTEGPQRRRFRTQYSAQ